MANYNRSEEARRNRMSAMVDDDEAPVTPPPAVDPYEGRKQLRDACAIPLDRIIADPDQPRKEFDRDALGRLAESLKARGQLQPIRVRWDQGRGVYVVVVGERRWRAARLAGMQTLACVVVTGTPTAADLLEDQLVENALREDLKPVEQARAFRTLMGELGLTQQQLAAKLQISQTTVSQSLTLLALAEPVRAAVEAGEIAPSAAYQIARVADLEAQSGLAARVVAEGLSRAETAKAVRNAAGKEQRGKGRRAGKGKGRKVTGLVLKTPAGKVTVENRKGLDDALVVTALRAALGQAEDRLAGAGRGAA
jgi:ParB family chromosome partitioning protein